MAFYAALFGARTDVYALRWDNAASGRGGWMPAVRGGWRKGRPPAEREYLPLTGEVITAHLSGDDRDRPVSDAGRRQVLLAGR